MHASVFLFLQVIILRMKKECYVFPFCSFFLFAVEKQGYKIVGDTELYKLSPY